MTSIKIHWDRETEEGIETVTSTITEDKIVGTSIISGKNQPYSRVEVTLPKGIFNSDEEGKWGGSNLRPQIQVGKSTIDVDTYGSATGYIISNVTSDDDYTIVTAHNPAYRLSYTLFRTLFSNVLTVNSVPISSPMKYAEFEVGLDDYPSNYKIPNDRYRASEEKGCQNNYTDSFEENVNDLDSEYKIGGAMKNLSKYTSGKGYTGNSPFPASLNKYTFWYQRDGINLIFHIVVTPFAKGLNTMYARSIEWIEGTPDDIVRFIIAKGLKREVYPQYFSTPKTYYPDINKTTPSIEDDVKLEYTEAELKGAYNKGLHSMNKTSIEADPFGTPIGSSIYTERLRIRVNGNMTCSDLIDSIATLTNRTYSFSDEGFFMVDDVFESEATEYFIEGGAVCKNDDLVKINDIPGLLLDFDVESEEVFKVPEGGSLVSKTIKAEPLSESSRIQDNSDAIVLGSQTVEAENYKVTITNISSTGSSEGKSINLPMIDSSRHGTYSRRMTNLCAYNTLVRKYKYEPNVIYNISELDHNKPSADKIFEDIDIYEAYISNGQQDKSITTILYDDGIVSEKRMWVGGEWIITDLSEDAGIISKYSPKSFTRELRDNYNGLVLYNVPLALIVRSYPEYITTLMWGRSETNDLASHVKEQESESISSSTAGNEDAGISNKYSSKIVIGNMTQEQLTSNDDSRSGYTGLIMEKNIGEELYRLAGYNDGVVQAEFNTEGKISAGGGNVILDEDGFKMVGEGVVLNGGGLVFTDGDKRVTLNKKGLKLEDNNILQVILDGASLRSGDDNVVLSKTGLTVKDGETTKVVLDKDGLRAENVLLDNSGLTVSNSDNNTIVKIDKTGMSIKDSEGTDQVKLNESGLTAGAVVLDDEGLTVGEGRVILNQNGLTMVEEGVSLSGVGLSLWDDNHGKVILDKEGMRLFGKKIDDVRPLRLIIDGFGVRDGVNRFLINENGLSVTEAGSLVPFLKVNEEGFSLKSELDTLERSLFEVKGEIDLSEKQIDGGGVTLSKNGLIMSDEDVGSVILANTESRQGLLAVDKNNIVQLSLTGKGLSLPGDGTEASPESMKLDREGITFKKGKDGVIGSSIIKMNAGELVFSTYMDIANVEGYYEQVVLDNKGLSVHNDAVKLNMEGLSFNQGGVVINSAGFSAKGVTINEDGFGLYKDDAEGTKIKVVEMTQEGLSIVNEESESIITLNSDGLTSGGLTIDREGLKTLQGGVNISEEGIDASRSGRGVKLNRDGLSLYTEGRATDLSTLKFRMGDGGDNYVTMGTISSEQHSIPVPDVTSLVNGGTSVKNTYVTTVDGASSDSGDSTLILRSTSGGLTSNTRVNSPQMSNVGVPMFLEYTGQVTLGAHTDGIKSIRSTSGISMGLESSKFPLGICNTNSTTRLVVETKIFQPCGSTNWGFIKYDSITVKIGGVSFNKSLGSISPTNSSRIDTLYSGNLKGVQLGTSVDVTLHYHSTMDAFWFLFEGCRPSIKVTSVEVEGGITTRQNATLPASFSEVTFSNAYWCGSFVELSHMYKNTIINNTEKNIYFKAYRDKVYTGASGTISSKGTALIDPAGYNAINRTGMYNAQYSMAVNGKHSPATLKVTMDAYYTSLTAGGGHIYLRPDGSYLRGNTELRGGDSARLSIRSGGEGWGLQGIDFHNSNVNFNTAKLDGSPVLSQNFMNSIRSNLALSTIYVYVASRPGGTWHRPYTPSCMNIVMITQNHQNIKVHVRSEANTQIVEEVFHGYDQNNGDGWATATFVVPKGYTYKIETNRGTMRAYEFPLTFN